MRLSARGLGLLCALALVTLSVGLGAADGVGGVPLPIRKVILYKNGMGYFEHLGEVRGAVPVEITFSSAQLNRARVLRAEIQKQNEAVQQRLELGGADQVEVQAARLDLTTIDFAVADAENASAIAAA